MTKITVYELTETHCGNCEAMFNIYSNWVDKQDPDVYNPLEIETLPVEENLDEVHSLGQAQAPVWVFDYEDGYGPQIVSGKNPARLIHLLEQTQEEIWD